MVTDCSPMLKNSACICCVVNDEGVCNAVPAGSPTIHQTHDKLGWLFELFCMSSAGSKAHDLSKLIIDDQM